MKRALAFVLVPILCAVPHGASVASPQPRQATARPDGDGLLMPGDAAVAGWKKSEAARVFGGADLYGYIDGGAELFLEFGFDRLTLQKFRSGRNELAVEIYRMADPIAATGIYLMKCGKPTRDPSFAARHTINRHQLMFVRERYFVTVNNLSGGDAAGADLVKFGRAVASALPADRVPVELSSLPARGMVAGSERLVRGPFGLQSIFTLGEGDVLQLGGRIVGVAEDVRDEGGEWTRLVVVYPDGAAAARAFANLRQHLDSYLKPVTSAATRLVFRDFENKFGAATVNARTITLLFHLARAPQDSAAKR
jgi:hypothetical protein